jgi:hypothetical protein
MEQALQDAKYGFISAPDKAFIAAFDGAMRAVGYEAAGIGNGYCWGRYMVIYSKASVKNKKVVARVYIRENGVVLRLFFSNIDRHSAYIENAPDYIRRPFVGGDADCHHCESKPGGVCAFRKVYTIGGNRYEKCSGVAFEFYQPDIEKLPGYMALLKEFFPRSRA